MKKLAVAALGAVLLLPASAPAATKNGITPLAPKAGAKVAAGTAPTFRMRVKGKGTVWVHVCRSKKKNKDGVICSTELIRQAKTRKGSTYSLKAPFFDFPEFWLNSPGTYYWQVHRIQCTGGSSDCRKEGPIVALRVT
jgi:hypothetical protein